MTVAEGRNRKIGQLARSSGLTVRTLHHYDHIGLVRPSARTPSGHRLYNDADIRRLYEVIALRDLGL
ncbi:MAG: MerR family DNA-binding transcriptional regulator, partial [Actinomycetota bacterium]|nr:MerR family DNA-binding transcriptional regulator [Actinomycetota bacterium]